MADVASADLPVELPREVLSRLDPKLKELHSQLSAVLASRISVLVREALPQGIHPDRVFKFAFLYAQAEQSAQGDAVSKEHTRRSRLELAGRIHGLRTGYRDDAEAAQRYRKGRQARHQINGSLEALRKRWQAFEQVVEKHRSALPLHLQSRFSDATLREVAKGLHNMGIATVLDEKDLASRRDVKRERSEIAQTYIWWRLKMAPYRGKWSDMHQLAFAWRMSPSASLNGFRVAVSRICSGASSVPSFGGPLESLLSEKTYPRRPSPPPLLKTVLPFCRLSRASHIAKVTAI
jgi:hypothetical protein